MLTLHATKRWYPVTGPELAWNQQSLNEGQENVNHRLVRLYRKSTKLDLKPPTGAKFRNKSPVYAQVTVAPEFRIPPEILVGKKW